MDLREIEDIILEFLAEDAQTTAGELRETLLASGPRMPVDSVLAVEVLTRVQRRTGVVLRPCPESAAAMRSVHSFAEAVHRQLSQTGPEVATA